ncbi:hypothetical protein MANES_11G151001v8 [Manihot esculenta]|uniref:Uncharacterized protein n=1 Tax=Manihot esculenta TaxID=3983 RepID=A0ACB7GW99_MANES|nr:hypothetical protein MANES_11G151001v8 [Manihot esculenta]
MEQALKSQVTKTPFIEFSRKERKEKRKLHQLYSLLLLSPSFSQNLRLPLFQLSNGSCLETFIRLLKFQERESESSSWNLEVASLKLTGEGMSKSPFR